MPEETSFSDRVKRVMLGGARDLHDKSVHHKLSLIALLAWVGLGSDGLSSSCYGPAEAFTVLQQHPFLMVFVALATAITVFVIGASYSQIVELFPTGGGGYLVASKLLSPTAGAVSGCALLVDYVLTISLSIAAGTDALFSFLPPEWHTWKLTFSVWAILALCLMNIRGVRESVAPLVPIFAVFVLTHAFVILYAVITHAFDFGTLAQRTSIDMSRARTDLGLFGMIFLVMKSYSMGAGTYTGIEAVSNGIPMLREPRVQTAKRTMLYMCVSLALTASGLMLAYLLYRVTPDPSGVKTLNAMVLETMTAGWGGGSGPWGVGPVFVIVTLLSEAAILCIAAQTGFLDGPRVLANMALDRWLPQRLSMLSDRLVIRNGILIMTACALATVVLARGAVSVLIVLYSINVFITFALSQTGMVRHWWLVRHEARRWLHGMMINGLGLVLTVFILIWVTIEKFTAGGWATLVVTAGLMALVFSIRRHYKNVEASVNKFNQATEAVFKATAERASKLPRPALAPDPRGKTAVLLVGNFGGLGMHCLQNIIRYFPGVFKNFVFLSVGVVDAGNFKGSTEVEKLGRHVKEQANRYVELMQNEGYYAESFTSVGTDIAEEAQKLADEIIARYPESIFFAGQLVFEKESFATRLLHNNFVFAIQRRLYRRQLPFVVLPFRV
jgi:amino acid transporter